jgi:hypothetical protein
MLIFDSNQGKISIITSQMEKFLLSRGLFDFSFLATTDFEDFVEFLKQKRSAEGKIAVICENSRLDEALERVKVDEDKLSLLNQQAVALDNDDGTKMVFVPSELDFVPFLCDFLPKRPAFVCSIFGKSKNFVDAQFEKIKENDDFDFDYYIITKSPYSHVVYYSNYISLDQIESAFGECFYSDKDESVFDRAKGLLSQTGFRLLLAEYGTFGNLSASFKTRGSVFSSADELKDFGVSVEALEAEDSGKDVSFALCKTMLAQKEADVAVAIYSGTGAGEKSYVSVGDKEVVHIYSSVFPSGSEEKTKDLCEFAAFRLVCFLQKK